MRFRDFSFLISVLIILLVISPFSQGADLEKPWLKVGEQITSSKLEILYAIAKTDPEVSALTDNAIKAVHGRSFADLEPFIRECKATEGDTFKTASQLYRSLGPDEIENTVTTNRRIETERTNLAQQEEDVVQITVADRSYLVVDSVKHNGLCLLASQSVREAYLLLVHELVHFTQLEPVLKPMTFLEEYPDLETYIHAVLLEKGNEVDAYKAQIRAGIHLDGNRKRLSEVLAPAFNDDGNLVNVDVLMNYILNDLDYKSIEETRYRDDFFNSYTALITTINFASKVLVDRLTYNLNSHATHWPDSQRLLEKHISDFKALKIRYETRLMREKIVN